MYIKVGCIEIVQMMTEDDAMDGEIVLCQATTSGWTPLHACVLSGDGDMLRLLLEGKANPRLETDMTWGLYLVRCLFAKQYDFGCNFRDRLETDT